MRWLLIERSRWGKEKASAAISSHDHQHSGRNGSGAVLGSAFVDVGEEEKLEDDKDEMGWDDVAADLACERQGHAAVKLMEHLVTSQQYDAEAVWEVACRHEGMGYHQVSMVDYGRCNRWPTTR